MANLVNLYKLADLLSDDISSLVPCKIYVVNGMCVYEDELVVTEFMHLEQMRFKLLAWLDRIECAGWIGVLDKMSGGYSPRTMFQIPDELHRLQFQLEFC